MIKNRKSETSLVSLASYSCSKYYFSVFISLAFCTLLNFLIFYRFNKSEPTFVHNEEVSYTNFDDEIKPIAIVFPQYHSVPENDQFWGKDFTEWTFLRPMERNVNGMIMRKPHSDIGKLNTEFRYFSFSVLIFHICFCFCLIYLSDRLL